MMTGKPVLAFSDDPAVAGVPGNPQALQGRAMDEPCIMMVDDEPVVSEVLRLHLEDSGYRRFEITTDSTAAVGLATRRQPDLLLLDLMMPEVTGFEVLEALRAAPATHHLPVIVLTSATDSASKLRALKLGATDFLAKPVDPSELILRVRNTLAVKAYQDRLAFFDRTTDLPNRRRFLDRLARALDQSRDQGVHCAVLQIGVDRFKQVNDAMGYAAGDHVLRAFGGRLRDALESAAASADASLRGVDASVARTGGDEFAAVLPATSVDAVSKMAETMRAFATQPITVNGELLYPSASVGIAVAPLHGDDVDALLARAAQALSYVKRRGGSGVAVFSERVDDWSSDRLLLERDLREALSTGTLGLEYQPKVNVATGRVTGAEALLRWNHPDRGHMSPAEFVPLAEETGLIVEIGAWALQEACRQAAAWQRPGCAGLSVAVNISPRQFQEPGLYDLVRDALGDSGLRPDRLTLEVTEGLLFNDLEQAARTLEALGSLGVTLSVDDFGTGYSSLSYLKRLRVHELKIDKSFLDEIPGSENAAAIVNAVIAMARVLGLAVVAEGVESPSQLAFLKHGGCDTYQGFLHSRSLTGADFVALAGGEALLPARATLGVG